jgi:hypothetical protein
LAKDGGWYVVVNYFPAGNQVNQYLNNVMKPLVAEPVVAESKKLSGKMRIILKSNEPLSSTAGKESPTVSVAGDNDKIKDLATAVAAESSSDKTVEKSGSEQIVTTLNDVTSTPNEALSSKTTTEASSAVSVEAKKPDLDKIPMIEVTAGDKSESKTPQLEKTAELPVSVSEPQQVSSLEKAKPASVIDESQKSGQVDQAVESQPPKTTEEIVTAPISAPKSSKASESKSVPTPIGALAPSAARIPHSSSTLNFKEVEKKAEKKAEQQPQKRVSMSVTGLKTESRAEVDKRLGRTSVIETPVLPKKINQLNVQTPAVEKKSVQQPLSNVENKTVKQPSPNVENKTNVQAGAAVTSEKQPSPNAERKSDSGGGGDTGV